MLIKLNIKKTAIAPVYYPYLTKYDTRYEVYFGGAGSGKSYFIAQKILVKALISKRKILVVRKVATTLKDSVFALLIDMLKKWKLHDKCKINLSTFTIELPNDSLLLLKGLDDSEKIKSITDITDIWIEEATELTENDFTQLDLRLRANVPDLQMFLSFNPVSKINWCYKRFFANGAPPNTEILKTTYLDNPFLPAEYIASLEEMKNTNPTYYKIYALGEFCSLDKLVFNNWEIGELPLAGTLICGLDFGYVNDPSALITAYVNESAKTIYINDCFYKRGLLNNEIAEIIKYKGLSKEIIIADSAEQKSIEEIKRLGVPRIRPATKGAGSIRQGIAKLQQYKIVINPACEDVIIEFQNYSYKKDKLTGEYTNTPIDAFCHAIDSLRYSLQAIEDNKRLQTLSKNVLF